MGVYGAACGIVGLSILLSVGHSSGAASGAAKWWLVCAATVALFGQPTLLHRRLSGDA